MGFWSTLASIGAGVAAPFTGGASLWAIPAIQAGGAAADYFTSRGGGEGGGYGGGGLPELSEAEKQMLEGLNLGIDQAGQYVPKFLDRADQAGGAATDYFTGVLEGDTGKRAEFMSPELEAMQRNYQSAIGDIERFGPRGGERDRALTESRLRRAGDTSRIMSRARPEAAKQLAGISAQQGQIGTGLNQSATSGAATGLGFLSNRRRLGLMGRDLDYRQQAPLWDIIGSTLESVTSGIGKKKKKKKQGGSSSSGNAPIIDVNEAGEPLYAS